MKTLGLGGTQTGVLAVRWPKNDGILTFDMRAAPKTVYNCFLNGLTYS